jgi:hypothetical protein
MIEPPAYLLWLSQIGLERLTGNQKMSMPKIIPAEITDFVDVSPLVVEEKTVWLSPQPPRPMLPSRIAVAGNYLPRHCGIATFTTDLCDAIHAEYGAIELLATRTHTPFPTRKSKR